MNGDKTGVCSARSINMYLPSFSPVFSHKERDFELKNAA